MQHSSESPPAPDDGPDELEALLDSYSQQAAAETNALLKKQAAAAPGSRKAAAVRERGLQTALAQDNKGFQLLQKMGYNPGSGLGSSTQGRSEPLQVQLKMGRTGLGVDEARRAQKRRAEEAAEQQAIKRQQQAVHHQQHFQEHRAATYALHKARKQLHDAQQACITLDEQAGIQDNPLIQPAAGGAAQEQPHEQRARTVTGAGSARDENELDIDDDSNNDAPGATYSDHLHHHEQLPEPPAISTLPDVLAALHKLLAYMRSTHLYCLYCGCRYDGEADMEANCPGMCEEDHE